MVLQAEVPKGPCHGEARCILVWQPQRRHVRFIIHGEDSLFTTQDPRSFACGKCWKIWFQVSGELDWDQTVLVVPGAKNST
uniref:Uncharacterized protein n=1 Tax=Arundo donax TaxID=35708 RepID=A0A0A9EEL1_ARUDO